MSRPRILIADDDATARTFLLGSLRRLSPDLVTEAARLFHALRGASMVMGASRLARACGGLESAATACRVDAAGVWWARVAIEYELAAHTLRAEMPPPGTGTRYC